MVAFRCIADGRDIAGWEQCDISFANASRGSGLAQARHGIDRCRQRERPLGGMAFALRARSRVDGLVDPDPQVCAAGRRAYARLARGHAIRFMV